jgi:hypothetical protein
VDFARAREARRLRDFQARCRTVVDVNRGALGRLFQTGLIFTRQGARLGRDLLRVSDLLEKIGELPKPGEDGDAAALYEEAQALLARTTELAARCSVVLARGS